MTDKLLNGAVHEVRSISGRTFPRQQVHKQENGRRTAYWALVEFHRTATGPRHRVVAWLRPPRRISDGDELPREELIPNIDGRRLASLPAEIEAVQSEQFDDDLVVAVIDEILDGDGPILRYHIFQNILPEFPDA